jgi:L-ascorbate metabolism protein UlaG (beta-lactamase superfamily)
MSQLHYLKPNVAFEPLINQWYANEMLLSPAHFALFFVNQHMQVMESFVQAPQMHMEAARDPVMMGAPFMNQPVEVLPEVQNILVKNREKFPEYFAFAKAYQEFYDVLLEQAEGFSIEPFYEKLPEALRGYVELVYDINNNPLIRFFEGLLYKSPYYKPELQTIAVSVLTGNERSSIRSTPRLQEDYDFSINVPFCEPILDDLFRMRTAGGNLEHIKQGLGIPQGNQQFDQFFTTQAPAVQGQRFTGDGVRVRYFGHACILIETAEVSILVDALISYEIDEEPERLTLQDLPDKIDYLLLTHSHSDHVVFETLLQIRHKIGQVIVPKGNSGYIADPSLKLIFTYLGFDCIRDLDDMEEVSLPDGKIVSLPFLGEHSDLNVRSKNTFWIELKERKILIIVDSKNIDPTLNQHLHQHLGDVDMIFMSMLFDVGPLTWGYGALLPVTITRKMDRSRKSSSNNYDEALKVIEQFSPKQVYFYAMGYEPWLSHLLDIKHPDDSEQISDASKMAAECQRRNIASKILYAKDEFIMKPGVE